MTKSLKALKSQLLKQPAVLAEYEAQSAEFEMARELIAARTRAGLTQSEVAARMGTTQSVIARIEGGSSTPSLRSVQRYAQAIGFRAVVHLEPLPESSAVSSDLRQEWRLVSPRSKT